jgi:hypothetical protein
MFIDYDVIDIHVSGLGTSKGSIIINKITDGVNVRWFWWYQPYTYYVTGINGYNRNGMNSYLEPPHVPWRS